MRHGLRLLLGFFVLAALSAGCAGVAPIPQPTATLAPTAQPIPQIITLKQPKVIFPNGENIHLVSYATAPSAETVAGSVEDFNSSTDILEATVLIAQRSDNKHQFQSFDLRNVTHDESGNFLILIEFDTSVELISFAVEVRVIRNGEEISSNVDVTYVNIATAP